MDHERFRDWFSHVDELTAAQCARRLRRCCRTRRRARPRWRRSSWAWMTSGAVRIAPAPGRCRAARHASPGLRRYRCKACGKTFGALTGTALSGLHHKERWLAFGASLGVRRDDPRGSRALRDCAEHGVSLAPPLPGGGAPSAGPACRDRRGGRDLSFSRAGRGSGSWIASRAGAAARPANAASRAPCAQVPILVAADRAGATLSPNPARSQRKEREGGAGAGRRPRCLARLRRQPLLSARRSGARAAAGSRTDGHQRSRRSRGERVRGALHIQLRSTAAQPDQGLPARLPRHRHQVRRIDTPYLRWSPSHRNSATEPSPRACSLKAAIRPCLRFAN